MGSTWDLRPIDDRFESHPEGSVYFYHRHRVPIYVYVLTSRRVFRAFLYIFLIFLKLIFLCIEGRILRPTVLNEVCMTIISEVMVIFVVKNNGHLGDTLSYSK